jgi:hypothetical protein
MNYPRHRKRVTRYGHTFDSIFESKVAGIIQPLIYKGCSYSVHTQLPIKIDAILPSQHWACDFTIECQSHKIFVEAKGFKDLAFYPKLQLLDVCYPSTFSRLLVVLPDDPSFDYPSNWDHLGHRLIRLRELKERLDRWQTEATKNPIPDSEIIST